MIKAEVSSEKQKKKTKWEREKKRKRERGAPYSGKKRLLSAIYFWTAWNINLL